METSIPSSVYGLQLPAAPTNQKWLPFSWGSGHSNSRSLYIPLQTGWTTPQLLREIPGCSSTGGFLDIQNNKLRRDTSQFAVQLHRSPRRPWSGVSHLPSLAGRSISQVRRRKKRWFASWHRSSRPPSGCTAHWYWASSLFTSLLPKVNLHLSLSIASSVWSVVGAWEIGWAFEDFGKFVVTQMEPLLSTSSWSRKRSHCSGLGKDSINADNWFPAWENTSAIALWSYIQFWKHCQNTEQQSCGRSRRLIPRGID